MLNHNPEGPYKEVSFTVKEDTWMNDDISPGDEWKINQPGNIF